MRRPRSRPGSLTLLLCAAAALFLTTTGTRLAASQEAVLTANETDEEVPAAEPWDPFWDGLPQIDIPVSAQTVTPPMGGRGSTMSARAVHDGQTLFLLVEWSDPSADRSLGRTEDFTDAVAVQFPAAGGTRVPAFCMGDPTAEVNIWQWRAAWQADVNRGYRGSVRHTYPNAVVDAYPFPDDPLFQPGLEAGNPFSQTDRRSAVDNLIAGGFGTLTADPFAQVAGWGQWREGVWRVVFTRPLEVGREGNVELRRDTWTDVAFAIWDGAAEERDGMKSVANFIALDVEPEPLGTGGFPEWPLLLVLGAWVAIAAIVALDLPRAGR